MLVRAARWAYLGFPPYLDRITCRNSVNSTFAGPITNLPRENLGWPPCTFPSARHALAREVRVERLLSINKGESVRLQ